MDIIDFLNFLQMRKKITDRKLTGMSYPWTSDVVLQKTRFTNLDRTDDFGTRELMQFTFGMNEVSTLFYIIMYRCCYSSSFFLAQMTGDWRWDLHAFQSTGLSNLGRKPYQVFLKKRQNIERFLLTTGFDVWQRLVTVFPFFNRESLEVSANIIADYFKITHDKRQPFMATEIAKDISAIYPSKVDPDSWCLFNVGAIVALRLLPGKSNKTKVNSLLSLTGLTPSVLEHSLCEWGKYVIRWNYYNKNGYFHKAWLYTQRP